LKITTWNAICFFPFIFLWLPALWFGLKNPRNDSKVKKYILIITLVIGLANKTPTTTSLTSTTQRTTISTTQSLATSTKQHTTTSILIRGTTFATIIIFEKSKI